MAGQRHPLDRLRESIEKRELEALLVSKPANMRYLCGFTGSTGYLVVTPGDAYLVTDFRYAEQAESETRGVRLIVARDKLLGAAGQAITGSGATRVGFESEWLSYAGYQELRESLGEVGLTPTTGLVERLRAVKGPEELARIRRAAGICDAALGLLAAGIKPGQAERAAALALEVTAREMGADGMAFDTIVASGPRSAMPHASPTGRHFQEGEPVLIDCGVALDGYCSDITRTIFLGQPPAELASVQMVVLEAQMAALEMVRPGVRCADVDAAARRVIADAGYGERFGHGLGHGVGLEVHEAPRLAASEDATLEQGMVVTVEPGVYLPGQGGVRIEDLVVVTAGGHECLTGTERFIILSG